MDAAGLVSIHVPLAEHDRPSRARWMPLDWFQFTCPSRSTTARGMSAHTKSGFQFTCPSRSTTTVTVQGDRDWKFQFTYPSRSTTCITAQERLNQVFQFTCPSRSTTVQKSTSALRREFQFTCPSRSTTECEQSYTERQVVSIHVPLAEHDGTLYNMIAAGAQVSIHVPLAEHDPQAAAACTRRSSFNSRAPRGARQDTQLLYP